MDYKFMEMVMNLKELSRYIFVFVHYYFILIIINIDFDRIICQMVMEH
jgi:hypothetical protein